MQRDRIKVVSFDLWDTVLVDGSDEVKRKNLGLLPKKQQRRKLVRDSLESFGMTCDPNRIDIAYDTADAAFSVVWSEQQVTWSVDTRLKVLLAGLGCDLPRDELDGLVLRHEEMEMDIIPDLAPGIRAALMELRKSYRLAVISDTGFSPGRVVRRILIQMDLFDLFEAYVFSNEVGRSKPHSQLFQVTADLLGVDTAQMVHVGDREHNDVAGAQGAGCKAVLSTVVKDRGSTSSRADGVCDDYAKLGGIVDSLS